MLRLLSLLESTNLLLDAATWVHKWSWESGFKGEPSPDVRAFLEQFKPARAVVLYRWQRVDHDGNLATTAPAAKLQSWSRDRELIIDVVQGNNEEDDQPKVEMLTRRFEPSEIFTDFTLFPRSFLTLIDSIGGHSEVEEVLVYKR